ncbi:hypothetical protein MYAM1_001880 [Malassezia yamatoensis]|uniref:Derlin n=1 Tax=Malassezia yamatoensis TaxID=253288 RepID=A0AAJ5YRK2_9BASI|nr:hypothetical protein MYAM1_001880 [Malassezia yamatoensis]
MEFIQSLPPVTRALLLGEGLVTGSCLLRAASPYQYVLLWPLIFQKGQIWRMLTSFLYAGEGLALIFNTMFLFRTSTELEKSLIGNSADYTWALVIIASLIMYIWAAQMPDAQVSMMGMLALPAKYLPYANLAIDLIIGGPSLMMEAATGLASAFLWNYVRRARMPPGTSLRPSASLDGFLVKYIQPCLSTPAILRTWMHGNAHTRQTAYGTAFTPRTSTDTASSSWSWFARRSGQTPSSSGNTRRGASGVPDRDALRAAAEARLRRPRTE